MYKHMYKHACWRIHSRQSGLTEMILTGFTCHTSKIVRYSLQKIHSESDGLRGYDAGSEMIAKRGVPFKLDTEVPCILDAMAYYTLHI